MGLCFIIKNRSQSLYWGYALPEGHQKDVDKQDKTEVDFLFIYPHLLSIFGHNVSHVLRQRLTSFSAFMQGTRLSKSSTTFPTAISHLFLFNLSPSWLPVIEQMMIRQFGRVVPFVICKQNEKRLSCSVQETILSNE